MDIVDRLGYVEKTEHPSPQSVKNLYRSHFISEDHSNYTRGGRTIRWRGAAWAWSAKWTTEPELRGKEDGALVGSDPTSVFGGMSSDRCQGNS